MSLQPKWEDVRAASQNRDVRRSFIETLRAIFGFGGFMAQGSLISTPNHFPPKYTFE